MSTGGSREGGGEQCHLASFSPKSLNFFIGNLKPQVHPNTGQETKVLSCMVLEKKLHDKVFCLNNPLFTKKFIFLLKITDP